MLIGILEASAKWLLSLSVALLNAKVITVLTHTHIQRQYPVCEWSSGLFNVQGQVCKNPSPSLSVFLSQLFPHYSSSQVNNF